MRTRHTFVTAALGSMLALGAIIAPAHAASTGASASVANEAPNFTPSNAPTGALAICDWEPESNGFGGADVTKSIPLRTGPSATCDDNGPSLIVGQRLGGWCWYENSAGNKWYYVSTGGAAPYGWIYGGNIKGESTIETPCSGG
ncbi:hypothetical protein ACIP6X_34775 [Streptomyces coeruleorubidus]|uniref:hypothetical protein n=1 Tax=Streptomyces coeruleorubidus TaxID=116188 RepID=UPI0037FF146F